MLSFIKHNLTGIDGIGIFPVISLLIFFTFFVGLGIYVMRTDRKNIEEKKRIPLDEE